VRGFKIGDLVEFKSKHLEGTLGLLLDSFDGYHPPIWRIMWQGRILAIDECDVRRVGSV
jgi:hypothetical protein